MYGGTKEEMERLLLDAEKLDSTFTASRDANGDLAMSYADIVDAIHIVQTEMGITGTTALEASTTIQGSVASMKAAWTNFVTALADDNADVGAKLDALVSSFNTVINNVAPRIVIAFKNIGQTISKELPNLVRMITGIVSELLPSLLDATADLVNGMIDALPDVLNSLADALVNALPNVLNKVIDLLPKLLETLPSAIGNAIGKVIPAIINAAVKALANLPNMLLNAVKGIFEGGMSIVSGIWDGIKNLFSSSIPAEVSDGIIGNIDSNIGHVIKEGITNLKITIAEIVGNEKWADTLKEIKFAQELQDKIISEYNKAVQTIEQYSFENFEMEVQAKMSTISSLEGLISAQFDEDGNLIGSIALVQSYIDRMNSAIGAEIVTLDELPAELIISLAEEWAENHDIDALKQRIATELGLAFPSLENGQAEEFGTIVYSVMMDLYKRGAINYNDALNDPVATQDIIMADLEEAGMDKLTAEAFATAIISDSGAWEAFWSGSSNSATNSQLIAYLMNTNPGLFGISASDEATITAIADLVVKYGDDGNAESFVAEINKLKDEGYLTEEQVNHIINYTVTGVEDAEEEIRKLLTTQYEAALVGTMTDISMNLSESIMGAKQAMEGNSIASWLGGYEDAMLALNTYEEGVVKLAEEMWMLEGAEAKTGMTLEAYTASMLASNPVYEAQKSNIEAVKDEILANTLATVEAAGGWSKLGEDGKAAVEILSEGLSSGKISWEQFIDSAGDYKSVMTEIFDAMESGMDNDVIWEKYGANFGMKRDEFIAFIEMIKDAKENGELQADVEVGFNPPSETEVTESGKYAGIKWGKGVQEAINNTILNTETVTSQFDTTEEALEYGEDASSAWGEGFEANYELIKTNVSKVSKFLQYTLGHNLGIMMTTWGTTAATNFSNGLATILNAISTTMSTLTSKIREGANVSLYDKGVSAGQSFADGLNAMYNAVYNAARNLARAAKEGATITVQVKTDEKQSFWTQSTVGAAPPTMSAAPTTDATLVSAVNALTDTIGNMGIYIDRDKLVGAVKNSVNNSLADINASNKRGGFVYA